jgi:N-carbamoylputrescine amidase
MTKIESEIGLEGRIMPLKAGVVQFSPKYGRVVDNWARLADLVTEGAHQGAQLLVLPEMAWTGYLWPDDPTLRPWAEIAGAGPGQQHMAALATQHNLWLAFGFPEADGPRLYNSQTMATPDGRVLAPYRKTHLFEADFWWARPGDTGFRQWDSPWGPIGSGICMDLNYPDLVDFHARQGSAVLAFSTNWLDQDEDVIPYWETKLAGVDGGNFGGPALFANRGGEEYGVRFRGQSALFWGGRCVASLPGTDDGVLVRDFP